MVNLRARKVPTKWQLSRLTNVRIYMSDLFLIRIKCKRGIFIVSARKSILRSVRGILEIRRKDIEILEEAIEN